MSELMRTGCLKCLRSWQRNSVRKSPLSQILQSGILSAMTSEVSSMINFQRILKSNIIPIIWTAVSISRNEDLDKLKELQTDEETKEDFGELKESSETVALLWDWYSL